MNKKLKIVNVFLSIMIVVYLGWLTVNAIISGHPFSLLCYNCKSCDSVCVMGIDPQGFIAASCANDPDVYIYATNVRMIARDALRMDAGMVIQVDSDKITVGKALSSGRISPDSEVLTYRMKARHAAEVCIDCGACEKACPMKFPILNIIKDLKEDGKF